MKTGRRTVAGDRTSCGGRGLKERATKCRGAEQRSAATDGRAKYSGHDSITGGVTGETIEGRYAASTLYHYAHSPCNAILPSRTWGLAATTEQQALSQRDDPAEPVQYAQSVSNAVALTAENGEKKLSQKAQEITLTVGVFFDGAGNNAVNTENMLSACKAKHYSLTDPEIKNILERCAKEMMGVSNARANSYTGYYTNVHWLKTLYKSDLSPDSGHIQAAVYIEGIGTESGQPDDKTGQGRGMADIGVIANTDKAVASLPWVIQTALRLFSQKTRCTSLTVARLQFDIFGFSRGAAASRHFANRIQAADPAVIGAVRLGMQNTEFRGAPTGKVRFIGLFDTVAAIGVPANGMNPRNADTGAVNIVLRPGVAEKVFQITAQHECRFNFALNSVHPEWPELVLPGVHSDIGGGYLPVLKEDLFLSRPETETVPLRQADDQTRVYRRASGQLAAISRYPTLAPIVRMHAVTVESWHDDRLPQNRYGYFQKRSYAALTLRNRTVRHDWSKVVLRVMLDAAQEAGVIFDEIQQKADLNLPDELIPLCEKAVAMARATRTGQRVMAFTQDELDILAKEYIHCSAHWNALITDMDGLINGGAALSEVISFIHRPDEQWKRTRYNMEGKQL